MNHLKRTRTVKSASVPDKDEIRIDVKTLHAHPEKLSALTLEATSDGTWAWHIPSGETYFSPRYYTMLGYDPDELPANYDTWANLLHPDDLEQTRAIVQRHIENKSESYEVEFRLRTKSGGWLWILGRGKVIERDHQGHPVLMVGSHVNIDSRKRAEEKLARYQAELEDMVWERTLALQQTTSLLEATLPVFEHDPRRSRRQALLRTHRPHPGMRALRHVRMLPHQKAGVHHALRGGAGCLAGRARLPHPE